MTKYVKKQIEVEAIQWFKNGDHPSIRPFRSNEFDRKCTNFYCAKESHKHGWIETLEGAHIVCPGDWIVTGIKGEYYLVKDEIFKLAYERKEENVQIMSEMEYAKSIGY